MTKTRKIIVCGMSGSGKTTTAKVLSAELELPLISIDSNCFDNDWKKKPREEIINILSHILSGQQWIIDGMYWNIAKEFISKADIVVFVRINVFKNIINIIKRKLNHIFHPSEDTYIGNKKRIRLKNTRKVCNNRSAYFKKWNIILNELDNQTKVIRIYNTKMKTLLKTAEYIKSE
ncbi:MAG: AAA family ATPase [Clostridia bacterium]|nr:AAA family ATPase [Clostridia bacterium]